MTAVAWICRECAARLEHDGVMEHRLTTGHNNAALVQPDVPAGSGSSDEVRAQARRDVAAAIKQNRERRGERWGL